MLASLQVDKIDQLPISMLGLVDDIVGVTEAGFRAQQLNVMINVKTSEKGLQFVTKKCKYMIIGNTENGINSNLMIDSWKQVYE